MLPRLRQLALGAAALCVAAASFAAQPQFEQSPAEKLPSQLRFTLIKTAETPPTPEAMAVHNGSWQKSIHFNHAAVLVEHPKGRFLFDTGMGRQGPEQFAAEMPWWARFFLNFNMGKPVIEQVAQADIPPVHDIFASHAHWDHLSGALDMPDAALWLTEAEQQYLASDTPPRVFLEHAQWVKTHGRTLTLDEKPILGFSHTLDLFGDGKAILIGTPGHTPGSLSLLLTFSEQRRYLFVGDSLWRLEELAPDSGHKAWPSNHMADHDSAVLAETIQRLREAQALPGMTLVPAHDSDAQAKLGFLEDRKWIE